MFDFELGFTEQAIVVTILVLAFGHKKLPFIGNTFRKIQNNFKPKT